MLAFLLVASVHASCIVCSCSDLVDARDPLEHGLQFSCVVYGRDIELRRGRQFVSLGKEMPFCDTPEFPEGIQHPPNGILVKVT